MSDFRSHAKFSIANSSRHIHWAQSDLLRLPGRPDNISDDGTAHSGNPGRCLASLRSRPERRFMMGSEGEASQSLLRTAAEATFKPRSELPAHPSLHGTFVRADARIRIRLIRRTAPASDIPYCRSTSGAGSSQDDGPRQRGPWQARAVWPEPCPRPSTASFWSSGA